MTIIKLSIEAENALKRFLWDIERKNEDERYIKSVVEERLFQICAFCPCVAVRECSTHGCFLLRKGDIDVLRGSNRH